MLLQVLERPLQGYILRHIHPDIFRLIHAVLCRDDTLDGTEPGVNLVSLAHAAVQAKEWDMHLERDHLVRSMRIYLARRVLRYNPHLEQAAPFLDSEYFMFRGEELYRTWIALDNDTVLKQIIAPRYVAETFWIAIPEMYWPALVTGFDRGFIVLIDEIASRSGRATMQSFDSWRAAAFELAGIVEEEVVIDDGQGALSAVFPMTDRFGVFDEARHAEDISEVTAHEGDDTVQSDQQTE